MNGCPKIQSCTFKYKYPRWCHRFESTSEYKLTEFPPMRTLNSIACVYSCCLRMLVISVRAHLMLPIQRSIINADRTFGARNSLYHKLYRFHINSIRSHTCRVSLALTNYPQKPAPSDVDAVAHVAHAKHALCHVPRSYVGQ